MAQTNLIFDQSENPSTVININPAFRDCDPPNYQQVVNRGNTLPPSYESIFGRIIEAEQSSKGLLDVLNKGLLMAVSCYIGGTIVNPTGMIIIGLININQRCLQAKLLSTFLIFGGLLGFVKTIFNLSLKICKKPEESSEEAAERLRIALPQTILHRCILGWFVFGSIWVYATIDPHYDRFSGSRGCDNMLHVFTFWLITSIHITLALIMFFISSVTAARWLRQNQVILP